MMISLSPDGKTFYTLCVNVSLIKLLASVFLALLLAVGYVAAQLVSFLLSATCSQMLHVVFFGVLCVGVVVVARFLRKKAGTR